MGFDPKEPMSLESNVSFGDSMVKSFERMKADEFDYKKYIPKTFSYSQLKVFQTCPWQYRYAFILKIPVQGRHTFSFGKTLHHTLEQFFSRFISLQSASQKDLFGEGENRPDIPPVSELIDLYREYWIDEWYQSKKQKDEYYQKGEEILEEFYRIHKKDWPNTTATEQGFTLKIGEYTLRGSIDRIDEEDGKLHLIDYKTGTVPKNDRSIDKDQLTIYQIAAEEVLEEEVGELTYYYLNENLPKTFIATEKQKEKLQQKVNDTLNELHESDFSPTPSKQVCKFCDYKDICQYRIL
jgi:DNA helicase-2/ATP-dependent DNA helicase PcrA